MSLSMCASTVSVLPDRDVVGTPAQTYTKEIPSRAGTGLCPTANPCSCPTPGAVSVGGASYGCYAETDYHCTDKNPQV